MGTYFIIDPDQIRTKLEDLTKKASSDDGWSHSYQDENTQEEWLQTVFGSEYHGGGIQVLKRLPEPATNELIDIALSSSDEDDIIGASLELLERERYKKVDFRMELLSTLLLIDTSNLKSTDNARLKLIISKTELIDATNRKDIVGKKISQIQADAEYSRNVAMKAKQLLFDMDR